MKAPIAIIALCATTVQAFIGVGLRPAGQSATRSHSCAQAPLMSGSGIATTREGKAKAVEEVSALLEKSSMVFSIPTSRITANEMIKFRKGLPDGSTAKIVKNKLMRRASAGSAYEQLSEITAGDNCWVFVEGEENLAEPIKFVIAFGKDNFGKDRPEWQQPIKSGIFAGDVLDSNGVIGISKLPTKQELMQRLAIALRSVPTKLGRSIKLVPTKVGRAIKLALAEEGEDGGEASEDGGAPAAAAGAEPAAEDPTEDAPAAA